MTKITGMNNERLPDTCVYGHVNGSRCMAGAIDDAADDGCPLDNMGVGYGTVSVTGRKSELILTAALLFQACCWMHDGAAWSGVFGAAGDEGRARKAADQHIFVNVVRDTGASGGHW